MVNVPEEEPKKAESVLVYSESSRKNVVSTNESCFRSIEPGKPGICGK